MTKAQQYQKYMNKGVSSNVNTRGGLFYLMVGGAVGAIGAGLAVLLTPKSPKSENSLTRSGGEILGVIYDRPLNTSGKRTGLGRRASSIV